MMRMLKITPEENKLAILTDSRCDTREVVEFKLTDDKKHIFVLEGCEHYYSSLLNYDETTKLINGLKEMRSKLNTRDDVDIVKTVTKKITKNILIESLYESAEDLNLTLASKEVPKSLILDALTPIYLQIMNYLSDVEKHMVYAFIMRPRKVLDKTSEFITLRNLEYELPEPTKTLSVHAKKLVTYNILKVNTDNKKLFSYAIKDEMFKEWFKFRNKKPVRILRDG